MASGVFGYMGYDMVRLVENLPQANPDKLGVPDSIFLRPTVIAIFDNVEDIVIIVTPVWPRIGLSARAAYNQAVERIGDVVHDLDRSLPQQRTDLDPLLSLPEPGSNMSPDEYKAHGGQGQGVHPGRRHLPGRAVAALQLPFQPAALRALSIACGASTPRPSCTSWISAASR